MSWFRTGCTLEIKNSRKAILWSYTGFRKGGKVFPIPLATVLKSDCLTLKKQTRQCHVHGANVCQVANTTTDKWQDSW